MTAPAPDPTGRPGPRGVDGIVERQIRQAQDRGLFDDLPGAGRPLPGLDRPFDDNRWLQAYLAREGGSAAVFLPPALALRKEVEDLPQTLAALHTEQQVRAALDAVNQRILDALRRPAADGPPMRLMPVDVPGAVLAWRLDRLTRAGSATEPPSDPDTAPTVPPRRPGGRLRNRWFRRAGGAG